MLDGALSQFHIRILLNGPQDARPGEFRFAYAESPAKRRRDRDVRDTAHNPNELGRICILLAGAGVCQFTRWRLKIWGNRTAGFPWSVRAITLKQGPHRYPGTGDVQKLRSLTPNFRIKVSRAFGWGQITHSRQETILSMSVPHFRGRVDLPKKKVPIGFWLKSTRPRCMRVCPMPNQPQAG